MRNSFACPNLLKFFYTAFAIVHLPSLGGKQDRPRENKQFSCLARRQVKLDIIIAGFGFQPVNLCVNKWSEDCCSFISFTLS